MNSYDALLIVSFGGPEGMDEVMPFLSNVLRGRNVPEARMREVAHHYELFGGVSPINEQNRKLIAAHESWRLVFQSRSGPPTQAWLGPDICDHLRELKEAGTTDVVVAPVGFISDHMEVLYDLDTQARKVAEALGLNMMRAATVGAH